MANTKKVKISVTISSDLLSEVDQQARADKGMTRSSVIEGWLRMASRRAAMKRLERETAAYYDALSSTEIEDDESWSRAASQQFARLDID